MSIIKKIVRRTRSVYNRNHFKTVQVEHWSFPSGHYSRALMVVTMSGLYVSVWRDQSHRIWLPFLQEKLRNRINILPDLLPTAETIVISLIGSTVNAWAKLSHPRDGKADSWTQKIGFKKGPFISELKCT